MLLLTALRLSDPYGSIIVIKTKKETDQNKKHSIDVGSGMTKLQIVYVENDNTMRTVFASEWKMP
jgi:hypothetical protein